MPKKISRTAKSFLSSLNFLDNESPVFSDADIQNESIKWLKRRLLADTDLISYQDLDTQILRYKITELTAAKERCISIIADFESRGIGFLIVLKVVPKNSVGLLRNFRISNRHAVTPVFNDIADYCKSFSPLERELWFCPSIIDSSTLSLGGRISFSSQVRPTIVEIAWHSSPRRIEEYSHDGVLDFPFCRALQEIGQMQFSINVLRIPNRYLQSRDTNDYIKDYTWVLCQLYNNKDRIYNLCDMLFRASAREASIEFIVNMEKLRFIDWDTDLDLFQ